jgi:hypothetical protein
MINRKALQGDQLYNSYRYSKKKKTFELSRFLNPQYFEMINSETIKLSKR